MPEAFLVDYHAIESYEQIEYNKYNFDASALESNKIREQFLADMTFEALGLETTKDCGPTK
jgi:hypothetical protein